MGIYVAMLRGINLGRRNRVAMADLRALVARLGHRDVRTHVQSGNVVFHAVSRDATGLASGIERAIEDRLGLSVTVVIRTADEMADIVAGNPFPDADPAQLYVTLLTLEPTADRVKTLMDGSFEPDEIRVVGREAYLRCPNGYGRSKLSNDFLERKLSVGATTRNWRSVTTLAALAHPAD
jgi:uncharacterized protein (DUF1697 family)